MKKMDSKLEKIDGKLEKIQVKMTGFATTQAVNSATLEALKK